MRTRAIVAVALLALVPASVRAQETKPSPPAQADEKAVRRAVERGLAHLEKAGLTWWERRKCNACHHGGYLLWSHQEARQRGFAVDEKKLQDWTDRSLKFYLKDVADFRKRKAGYVEGASLVLARTSLSADKAQPGDGFKTIGEILALGQSVEGSWKYEGQALKRSQPENNEATTLWMILALGALEKTDPALAKTRTQALDWARKALPGSSNETLVLRLLIEHELGDREHAGTLLQELKKQQKPDGGWSWTSGRPSEPFATGQSLYALGRLGLTGSNPHVQRGWAFLLQKQQEDGSWESPSRKPDVESNPIASYWGSAWATLGLVGTLPMPAKASVNAPR